MYFVIQSKHTMTERAKRAQLTLYDLQTRALADAQQANLSGASEASGANPISLTAFLGYLKQTIP